MNLKYLLVAAIVLAAPAAFAQDDNPNGFYVGAGLGQFNVQIDDTSDLGGAVGDFDSDDDTLKVFAGYRLSPIFALELGYLDLGSAEDDIGGANFAAEIDGYAPFAILSLPLGPVELSAKAGYLIYDVSFEVDDNEVASDSSEDLIYGVGVGITLFDALHAKLEYEIIDIGEVDDADALWLSGAWRF
jgi:opacity protein-like surface antigen